MPLDLVFPVNSVLFFTVAACREVKEKLRRCDAKSGAWVSQTESPTAGGRGMAKPLSFRLLRL